MSLTHYFQCPFLKLFVVACEPTRRDKIRAGLEELQMVQPGGDTFMDRGLQRVSICWESQSAFVVTVKNVARFGFTATDV